MHVSKVPTLCLFFFYFLLRPPYSLLSSSYSGLSYGNRNCSKNNNWRCFGFIDSTTDPNNSPYQKESTYDCQGKSGRTGPTYIKHSVTDKDQTKTITICMPLPLMQLYLFNHACLLPCPVLPVFSARTCLTSAFMNTPLSVMNGWRIPRKLAQDPQRPLKLASLSSVLYFYF